MSDTKTDRPKCDELVISITVHIPHEPEEGQSGAKVQTNVHSEFSKDATVVTRVFNAFLRTNIIKALNDTGRMINTLTSQEEEEA